MQKTELKKLLESMSLQEKIDQMLQLVGSFYSEDTDEVLTGPESELGITDEDVRMAGSIEGTYGAQYLMELQKSYMEKQPHHIPMLFMMDVIHGMKTIFPIPLGQAAAFEPELSKRCASAAAKEAAVSGLHVTFAPMVDLVRDARWGRVMESGGEDPFLSSRLAQAQVEGFQGKDMSEPYKVCACVKHFAGYGAAQAGREYHTVELSEHTLRDFYLPAYKAGIDAGSGMVMTAFNTLNGIPASTNKWLMRDVLRDEMGFDGVLVSDFSAIAETVVHGHSEDLKDAAKKALEAGVDIDMMSGAYAANLSTLVKEGAVDEAFIDESVMRILELKNKLGLFENPYKDADPEKEKTVILCDEHRQLAGEAAAKSFVLLKNEGVLPVDTSKKTAFIGPYTNNKEIKSSWAFIGDSQDCVTIEEAAREVFDLTRTTFHAGSPVLGNDDAQALKGFAEKLPDPVPEEMQLSMLKEAVQAAKEADTVIMPLGEYYLQSGEATSRAMLDIPDVQMRLFREVAKVNENIIVVLFNGRPLDLREISRKAKAVLEVWLPGTEGGHAIVDVLTGKVNPSGKLPMSFPYCVGQIPVHYNEYSTGRPYQPGMQARYLSKYLDIPNTPLYPFGYGMSYTDFEISPVTLSGETVTEKTSITAAVTVKNTGTLSGTQTLQLYIQDVSASVVRPVKELKGFQKTELAPGEEATVQFVIEEPMLRFLRADGTVGSEDGRFRLWIGDSSDTENAAGFMLKREM
ncbi:MAG: beta-glucosidase BglX [Eubacteriales bacterium]|nr:beta-glucosidase BglX [Eubacteriales bacterium]